MKQLQNTARLRLYGLGGPHLEVVYLNSPKDNVVPILKVVLILKVHTWIWF